MVLRKWAALTALGFCLASVPLCGAQRLMLHRTRKAKDDLEIGGSLAGVPKGQTRFVGYAQLLSLPQESYTVADDTNFGKTVRISGVALQRLPALLGAEHGARMVTAVCDDSYAAHYPAAYLQAHRPLLVLRVNGKESAHWPFGVDGVPMGPYLVSHPFYRPSFQVLKHNDEAQVPWGVVRLDFEDERKVYAPIEPSGPHANDLLVRQGYMVARQNCFRCHGRGGEGGTKSNRAWDVVARRSAADPQWFDEYVRSPKKLNPASRMAASPQYDEQTLRALRAYFHLFAE